MPSSAAPVEPLIFLHNEKAAGVTLHVVMRRVYGRRGTFTIDGADVHGSLARLHAMRQEERDRIRLLKGHMPFGLHSLLREGAQYVSVMRDPVDRIASLHRYIRSHPGHRLHRATEQQHDLADFVGGEFIQQVRDMQTRRIAGVTPLGPHAGFHGSPDDILDLATDNVERWFACLGLQDRFLESVVLFSRRLGWSVRPFQRYNVTSHTRRAVPSEVAQAIEQANPLDTRLYAWAHERFEQAAAAEGPDFAREVDELRLRVERLERRMAPLRPAIRTAERLGRRVSWIRSWVTG